MLVLKNVALGQSVTVDGVEYRIRSMSLSGFGNLMFSVGLVPANLWDDLSTPRTWFSVI